ncbi:hypothetical protein EMIHUDRAFT_102508 [Emiliania huxleyi CCMP1516]|uniref:DUF6817 domain-containing protein n=2 Tax=Emiliania huxleyi TaxID=2903 RepID=A0A0D3J2T6_EMIH1|nr:hypothetical protein EMIHUDRAFT_102508 [Emiliania huxleyi CCMP1516]EOD17821.1 hypothetical protein EMIHUDRAFT_102508 [Emiliania huxleyi CCMP1516]|eukprot:XP_005770250.1 hypothetical protein EMIHUDRAFT_102508 [Emiliania huxleyi CCMP1516]
MAAFVLARRSPRSLPLAAARLCQRRLSTEPAYAVEPYRNLLNATQEQRSSWADADATLHAAMREHVPAALAHNGEEDFDRHLVGVQSVLRSWGAAERLTNAALFHSIYGTEGFQGYALPLSHRGEIAGLIGAKAERLAWIFCMVDRATVDATVFAAAEGDWPADGVEFAFRARPELGAFPLPLRSGGTRHSEWLDFLTLSLADWLEQVEGASSKQVGRPVGDGARQSSAVAEESGVLWPKGEAWAYRRERSAERGAAVDRREAYAEMAALLARRADPAFRRSVPPEDAAVALAAPAMHAEVFGREPSWSRGISQPTTPPMGAAALAAHEARESARCDFG